MNLTEEIAGLSGWVRVIPAWVPANVISVMRGLLIVPIYFAFHRSAMAWVIALFLLGWFSDAVDGMHARYRKQGSTLGKLLDPAADKVLIIGLLILEAPGRINQYLVYAIVSLEIVLVLLAIVLRPVSRYFQVKRRLGANIFGKAKMVLEGMALSVLLFGLDNRAAQQAAQVILWSAVLLAVLSIVLHLTAREETGVQTSRPGS
jgi:CDP-diacylglycerol---glycerol-3-phosphate 3-phosphatidyltransferase